MENVPSYKADKLVRRGLSNTQGREGPEVLAGLGPLAHLDNDLDLNDRDKLWVEKMNQLNTERSREDQTQAEHCKDDYVGSPEFQSSVYWKEPFPEVLPLPLDIEEEPAKVSTSTSTSASASASCPPGNPAASSSSVNSSQRSRALGSCLVSSVWLEKAKYEEAEVKYYRLQSRAEKSKPTMEVPHSDLVQTSTALDQEEDDLTFEDYLDRFARDNVETRRTLMSLTDCVIQLQERIKNLELGNKKQPV